VLVHTSGPSTFATINIAGRPGSREPASSRSASMRRFPRDSANGLTTGTTVASFGCSVAMRAIASVRS
jgi:hypothetical protein